MEKLGEYAEEESLNTETRHMSKEPVLEEITAHSSELMQTIKYRPYEEISGELKKIKPPTFNGDTEKGEEAESWLSGMRKYFQIYNYSNQLKARMAIYNLSGKADIWWQDLKRVKGSKKEKSIGVLLKGTSRRSFCPNNTMKRERKNFTS